MSLIHWWPLNGDPVDKITGISAEEIGSGVSNADIGCTGKCYKFTKEIIFTADRLTADYLHNLDKLNEFSMSVRVKLNEVVQTKPDRYFLNIGNKIGISRLAAKIVGF